MTQVEQLTVKEVARSRHYPLFLLALTLDELCGSLWLVSLGWVAARAHTSAEAGLILFAGGIPLALLLLFGGALVDRFGTSAVAVYTLTARVAVMAAWVVIVLLDAAPVATVAIAAAIVGMISGIHAPAMTTYPIVLVQDEGQQTSAVLERGAARAAQGAGGLTAGALIAHFGVGAPAALGTVCVATAAVIVGRLKGLIRSATEPDASTETEDEGFTARLSGGLAFVSHHPILKYTLAVQSVLSTSSAAILLATLPLRAHAEHWSPAAYGACFGAFGIAMFVSTLAALQLQRWSPARQVSLALRLGVVSGLAVVLIGLATTPLLAVSGCVLLGLALGPAGPILTGYTRTASPNHQLRGRVMSVLVLSTDAMEPVGFLLLAFTAGVFGSVTVPTVALGAAGIAVSAAAWLRLRAPLAMLSN